MRSILSCVTRGLSPSKTGVNALITRGSIVFRKKMDCRVERAFTPVFNGLWPGNDPELGKLDREML